MFGIKTSLTVGLLILVLNGAVLGACGAAQPRNSQNKIEPAKNQSAPARATPQPKGEGGDVSNDELKEIAGGGYSNVEDAFIAVVRDAETYAALGKAVGELPSLDADFFKTRAVVAAFLGTRRSGGYAVKITRGADGTLRVGETTPPKGAMTTQALTSPFRVVSVATSGEGAGVRLELDEALKKALRGYNVTEGEFTVSGGIAGRSEKFKLEGELRVARLDILVTIFFDLRSADKGAGGRARMFQAVATGTSLSNGVIQLPILRDASLINWTSSGLRATGQLDTHGDELTLSFESLPSKIADGFMGQGRLTAVSTATQDHNNPRGGKMPPE